MHFSSPHENCTALQAASQQKVLGARECEGQQGLSDEDTDEDNEKMDGGKKRF